MEIHIKIKAQRFKNANAITEQNKNWKPDGIQKFKLFIDKDRLVEDIEKCIITFKKMLDNMSNGSRRYQYIDYEIMDPVTMSTEEFERIYNILSEN
jgi:hypothetical protein